MDRLLAGFVMVIAVTQLVSATYPFMDTTLSWTERVNDLVDRLTLEEMTAQMARGGRMTYAPGIPRLGIKPYPWGAECLRGDVDAGPATSFPQALGLAATFSDEVIYNVTLATAIEVRAKYNNYSRHGDYGQHTSASCWSPVINIMRDPRWGRNQETYGEDPYMSGRMSRAFVLGLQGEHPRYIRANAGCKHFDVYAGPENIPESRHSFDAKVSERDWRMTFLPAFKTCVEAGSYSLMCSYNRINGVPACANRKLLTDILRGEWGFQGYVISDEGAIEDIMDSHKFTNSTIDTAAAAVNAGTNLEDGPGGREPYFNAITQAVMAGKLSMETVREAVKPLFYTRMRLGLFDPDEMNPYAALDPSVVVQNPEHRELSILSAMRSFVLLKNNGILPLDKSKVFDKVAIVGPMADNVDGIFGGYAPNPDPQYILTPKAGLKRLGRTLGFAEGCKNSDPKCVDYDAASLKEAVRGSQLVIVCLGTGASIEGEDNDRKDIFLPGSQLHLLQDAVSAADGAPVLLLLFNAGPLDVSWAVQNAGVSAILECFFPAQATGEALWRLLRADGEAANPAGRLPATWPAHLDQYPPITDYTMENRTYRYFTAEPLFRFGYGLSYSTFKYRTMTVAPKVLKFGSLLNVDLYVENVGPLDGEEVVQVYVAWRSRALPTPKLQLVGFGRYFVPSGSGISCHFQIHPEQLSVWDDLLKEMVVLRGIYDIYAGGQQPTQDGASVLHDSFIVI